ncbi:MAG: septal ring lytic transglycosylase RlpA family protein [Hyphomicrobiaceae bacterium]|nr:septal ring lytic transglycosylase RlpA family protein [Hyphomicrobiaceae bacterium]
MALGLLSCAPEAAAQDRSPFAWDQPSPASRWTARVEPAPRVADPRWTATVTWVRPELQLPMLATPAIPRRPDAPRLPATGPRSHAMEGIASFYWQDQMTASGERFDRSAMTAAHKTLPIGTQVRVTNVVNGRTVVVRINDRGPFKPGRVIDLSQAAAREIDMERAGLVPVKVEVVGRS